MFYYFNFWSIFSLVFFGSIVTTQTRKFFSFFRRLRSSSSSFLHISTRVNICRSWNLLITSFRKDIDFCFLSVFYSEGSRPYVFFVHKNVWGIQFVKENTILNGSACAEWMFVNYNKMQKCSAGSDPLGFVQTTRRSQKNWKMETSGSFDPLGQKQESLLTQMIHSRFIPSFACLPEMNSASLHVQPHFSHIRRVK